MNDLAFFRAVRKLPEAYLRPGINVSRFGEGANGQIIAAIGGGAPLPTLIYSRDGKWKKDSGIKVRR